MKKVLILAYDFPPYVSVGGLRPYSWYKYLKEYGIEPIVVTRHWDNIHGNHLDYIAPSKTNKVKIEKTEYGTIIRTPYKPNLANRIMLKYGKNKFKLIRRTISGYYEIVQWFFSIGPKINLFFAANEYIENNKVDAIIATGDPFILFKYASNLSHKYNISWIADYRDPWVQDKSRDSKRLSKKMDKFFEYKYVKTSHSVITVSTFVKSLIKENIPDKVIHTIPNGYDKISWEPTIINKQEKILKIAFSGSIYPWHPIELFLKVLNTFIVTNDIINIQVCFYGINNDEDIRNIVLKTSPDLINYVKFLPKKPYDELLKELGNFNSFLLFNDYSILGTKIFNYLYLRKKILFCFSNDKEALKLKKQFYNVDEIEGESQQLQEDLIRKTNSGIIVKDSDHLLQVLEDLYLDFTKNGFIKCHSKNIEQFSRKKQVERLAEIIKNI